MRTSEPPQEPEPPKPAEAPNDPSAEDVMATLFRVVRRFLPPFLISWIFAYAGSQGAGEIVFYIGMVGVGASVLGLLLWLLHH